MRPKIQLDNAAKRAKVPKDFPNGRFVLDSCDKLLMNNHNDPPPSEDPDYSGKELHRAQRYTGLTDLDGFVNKLWGGYSPKVYDADFVKIEQDFFGNNLDGMGVFVDNHYSKCKEYVKNVDWFYHYTKKELEEDNVDAEGIGALSKKKETYNKKLSRVRGRVESPWGIMEKKFECLKSPWQEDKLAQDDIVYLAVGVMNYERRKQ
jgi:hypothetical protein